MTSSLLRQTFAKFLLRNNEFHTTSVIYTFPMDKRSGYPDVYDKPPKKLSFVETVKSDFVGFKDEMKLWLKEQKEKLSYDPIKLCRTGEVDVVWRFNGDPEALDSWVVTCDSDYNEGFSQAKIELNQSGFGVFSGNVDTRVPKDGRITNAGYCNIRANPPRSSFHRTKPLDWSQYTHLILRVRGDGRTYLVNLGNRGFFDVHYNDVYHYFLFTRGGPYWQYVKIPFSKFFLGSKARIQDDQQRISLDNVTSFSITITRDAGPFKLEIDYVGLEHDETNTEEFAYELYKPLWPIMFK